MKADPAVIARLRAAGCVWAEDEASLLASAARSPAELDAMVTRRAGGEPIEQVIGWAEFCGLRVLVDPGVFVPRRRSEFLVSVAVGLARAAAAAGRLVVVDLCCGTGALGLAVAVRLAGSTACLPAAGDDGPAGVWPAEVGPAEVGPAEVGPAEVGPAEVWPAEVGVGGVELHAADLDPAAVACARRNVEPAGGHVHAGDLFTALPAVLAGRIDVLTCNAPYVPSSEIAFMPAEARDHEALVALDGGPDGLAVLRRAAAAAASWLAPGGVLLVETSERQAPTMTAAMTAGGLTPQVQEDDESGATVVTGVR